VGIEETANGVLSNRRHFESYILNPPGEVSGGAEVLLGDLERMTAALEVCGKAVKADAEIAASDALQNAEIGEEPIQHRGSFPAARALSGASMIMRTGSEQPLL
jgi:hypothetical protein